MRDAPSGPDASLAVGLTVREVARRYRVGEDKVRTWIGRGELAAINTAAALCGRPRWVITPDALADFEWRRAGGPIPQPTSRRRRSQLVDYYL
jgi:transposase